MTTPEAGSASLAGLVLRIDDDALPLLDNVTLGRHLDNDIIIAGEDVLDYHARIAVTDRAVTVHPLLDATIVVNGVAADQPVGMMPDDQIQIGASQVCLQVPAGDSEEQWTLHRTNSEQEIPLLAEQLIGRDDEAALQIDDDHISRRHARLLVRDEVWLADLDSANGTFVNGERIAGGVRLHHGDYVSFDTHRFQLIGSAEDRTPIRAGAFPALLPIDSSDTPELRNDTTVIGAIEITEAAAPPAVPADLLAATAGTTGAFFLGASEPVRGEIFRPGIGRSLFGRGSECDFVITDRTVSLQHAEVVIRAEGSTLTNLMATNGSWVNGRQVQSQQLRDGDIVRLGQVSLVFKDVAVSRRGAQLMSGVRLALLIGSALAAIALLLVLD